MSKIKLIASDLDGTLLLDSALSCNPELFPIVQELLRAGIYFMPASGRQYPSLQKLFAPVKNEIMYLCENGALVMYQDRVLMKKQFDDSLALDICHAVMDRQDCEVLISGERTSYLIPKDPWFVTHMRDDVGNRVTVVDMPERIEEAIIKVSFFTKEEKDRDIATEHFTEMFEDKALIITSGNRWVDFAPFGTSKGTALEVVSEQFGIAPEEMAAFGDNENDREMLSYVGHPYLMQDCNPSMLDMAGQTTRCNQVESALRDILNSL